MPRKSLTFLERYGEYFLLGVAVVLLAISLAHYALRSPHRVRYDGRLLSPGELPDAIRQRAEDLRDHISGFSATKTPVPSYHRMLEAAFAPTPAETGDRLDNFVLASLPRATGFGIPIPPVDAVDPERNLTLVPALRPVGLATTTGRSLIVDRLPPMKGLPDSPDAERPAPDGRAVTWVSVGGWFDPAAQREAFRAAGYSDYRAQVVVVGVELQRQVRLADGSYSGWQIVEPPVAVRSMSSEPAFDADGMLTNRTDLSAAFQLMKSSQAALQHPPFPEVVAGSPWVAPLQLAEPSDEASAGGRVVVWAHDDSAEPGRTCRYRLRVNLWNRFVGQARLLKNPDETTRSVVEGTWSQPTAPVVAAPDTHIFLASAQRERNRASVEVWKWHLGRWLRQVFDVGVGEVIGGVRRVRLPQPDQPKPVMESIDFGTGAVVVDLSFDVHVVLPAAAVATTVGGPEAKSAVLTYAVGDTVRQRVAVLDRFDPLRRELGNP